MGVMGSEVENLQCVPHNRKLSRIASCEILYWGLQNGDKVRTAPQWFSFKDVREGRLGLWRQRKRRGNLLDTLNFVWYKPASRARVGQ